jgi:hypothetical protein
VNNEQFNRTAMKQKVIEIIGSGVTDDIRDSYLDMAELFKSTHTRHKLRPRGYEIPGFNKLTGAIGGMPQNGFTIISGPTGKGKSTLVGNLWVNLSAIGKNIFTVPIETGPQDFMDMLLSIVSSKMRMDIGPIDYEEAAKTWAPIFFSNRNHIFSTHDCRLSHLDFLAEVYYHHLTHGVNVAFGDNWNYMIEPNSGSDAIAVNDKALHDCIVFSKKIPVHIYMIMHPNKGDKRDVEERVDSMNSIKGSISSIQEAHNVWLFNGLKNEEDAPPLAKPEFCREIYIAKARYNGRAVGTKVIYHIDSKSELYKEYKFA